MKILTVRVEASREDGTDMTEELKDFIMEKFTNVIDANECLSIVVGSIIDDNDVAEYSDMLLAKGEENSEEPRQITSDGKMDYV
ncbi:hypothetical protein LCGC14_0995180 [marine sediment metagenome]|uniref:Uncharacterized protein n=1 Tax=marine sediment metagenome TaxID=412755 RepID=A0A0F9N4L8_9ZZZZ